MRTDCPFKEIVSSTGVRFFAFSEAINMLVGTEAGDCFTEQEVTEILISAGFKNISKKEFETGLSQMIAQKI